MYLHEDYIAMILHREDLFDLIEHETLQLAHLIIC
jgi:hypothetical protein